LDRIRALAEKLGVLTRIRFRGRQNRAAVADALPKVHDICVAELL